MAEYDELIERLRSEAESPDNYPEDSILMREAADAIEELSGKLAKTILKQEKNSLTNADRIRAMTDEKLAKFLDCYCVSASWECPKHNEIKCHECWLEWLKKEVEA